MYSEPLFSSDRDLSIDDLFNDPSSSSSVSFLNYDTNECSSISDSVVTTSSSVSSESPSSSLPGSPTPTQSCDFFSRVKTEPTDSTSPTLVPLPNAPLAVPTSGTPLLPNQPMLNPFINSFVSPSYQDFLYNQYPNAFLAPTGGYDLQYFYNNLAMAQPLPPNLVTPQLFDNPLSSTPLLNPPTTTTLPSTTSSSPPVASIASTSPLIPTSTKCCPSEDSEDSSQSNLKKRKRTSSSSSSSSSQTVHSSSSSTSTGTITLSREDLLTFSSEQYEDYVGQITNSRELTPNEKNEVKRQRRLIKNRESAQASRQRRKSHIDDLEKKVKELTEQNSLLKENMSSLTLQNTQLKNEVSLLQSVVNHSGIGAIFNRGASFLNSLGKNSQSPQLKNHPTTGLVMLVILFSFGLFFNGLGYPKVMSKFEEPVSEVRILHRYPNEYKAASHSNEILGVLAEQKEIPVHRLENAYRRYLERTTTNIEETPQNLPLAKDTPSNTNTPTTTTSTPTTTHPESALTETESKDNCLSTSEVISYLPKVVHWKRNTTYLICDNIKQIMPPLEISLDKNCNEMPLISFLIPPDSSTLGNLHLTDDLSNLSTGKEGKTYIEVICQVIEMNYVPAVPTKNRLPQ